MRGLAPPLYRRCVAAAVACACAGVIFAEALAADATAATRAEGLLRQLQAGAGVPASERNAADLALLARFYEERQMRPLWTADQAATRRGRTLAAILAAAEQDGLDPDDYGATAIAALLDARQADDLAELELRLSLGLVQLTSDLASGRLEPSELDSGLFVYPEGVGQAEVIRAAAAAGDIADFVARFRPVQDEYRRLQAALADFRAKALSGDWVRCPPVRPWSRA